MLNLPAATLAAIQAKEVWAVNLLTIAGSDNTYYVTDHYKDITVGTDTFVANGHLLQIGNVIDATGIANQTLTLSLSGIDTTFRQDFLSSRYVGADVTIDLALLNTSTGDVIDDPLRIYAGIVWSTGSEEENSSEIIKGVDTQSTFTVTADVRSLDTILASQPGRFSSFNQFNQRIGLDPAQTDPAAADYPDFSMEYTSDFRDKNLHFGGS